MAKAKIRKGLHNGGFQLPLIAPECNWRPPAMSDLPSWSGARRIAIDTETYDPHLKQLGVGVRRGGYIVGVSFAIEDGPKHYLPIRHDGGDNMDPVQVLRYLRDNGVAFEGNLVGANISYDLDYLEEDGVTFPNVRYIRDVQIAAPLINEIERSDGREMSYSLQNIALRLGLPGKDEAALREAAAAYGVDPKSGLWRLPARYVGAYAEADATQPLAILRRQERLIDDEDLWDIYNLESEVTPVLVKMRRRGVRVDEARLEKIEDWSLSEEAEALATIRRETGVAIKVGDVWKSEALAPALEAIGMKLEKTSTGSKSVSQDVFASFDHPVTKAMARARKVNKLRTTFAASVRKYMVKGRIHCTYNQIARETENGDQKGARYGRLSAIDPNFQQQPSRDEFAAMWRSIYLPEEGQLWAANDYSQQEPRWTTHFAAEMDLEGARKAAQAYHDDPNLDNHQFMADLTGLPRKFAKNIFLGLCYGEGGAKLCGDLGLPTRWAMAAGWGRGRTMLFFDTQEEALAARSDYEGGYVWKAAGEEGQQIIDTFDSRAPFIRKLASAAERRVKQRGYIVTGGGRKLHFPQRTDGSYDWTHKSLNRLIQGTSADQTKRALVEVDRAGHWIMIQVHDELGNSVSNRKEAREIAEIMENVMPARVPFRVDVEIGPSWGEAA